MDYWADLQREVEELLLEQVRLDRITSELRELCQTKPRLEPESFWYNYGEALRN